MTLPDIDEHEEEENSYNQAAVSEAVVAVVQQGAEEGRVVCGVSDCIKLLGSSPGQVMFCLLAQSTSSQDASVQIQHVLIRAFCHENYIPLLHVHDQVKLTQLLLSGVSQPVNEKHDVIKPPLQENSAGYSCIVIKFPKHDMSHEDDAVVDYIKNELQSYSETYVTLPA